MNKWSFVSVIGALLICLTLSSAALAQVAGGNMSGTVSDPSGGAVQNAAVAILNPATGVSRSLTTNESGFYSAPNLVPGSYQVSITAAGFATLVEKVELQVGAELVLNHQLKVGDVKEQVVIETGAQTVETGSSMLSATVEGKTIRELPLNGRDWTQLATLEPGVHTIDTQTLNTLGNSGRVNRGWGTSLTVGGARPQQNNYRLDGISINDYSGGGPGNTLGANLGVESIQEFSVVNANPSGEYGKTSGGVFNAVTRSGTNGFHGSAFEFIRNSALDARNFFDGATVPPFRRNQFGFALGGPVYLPRFGEGGSEIGYNGKNRTFFFFNYEAWRESLSTTILNTVPSNAARAGRLTSGTVTINARVLPYLNIYPLPNVSESGDTGQASVIQKAVTTENFYTMRVDHKFSEANSMHSTFLNDAGVSTSPEPLNTLLQANFSKRKLITFEETHIFSPTLVNTARVGYSRVVADAPKTVSILNPILNDLSLGFLPGQPIGILAVTGLQRFQGVNGQSSDFFLDSYQAYDDLFYTRGDHSLKFGFAIERAQLNESTTSSPNGGWTYGSLRNFLTNAAPTSFLTTIPGTNANPTYLRQTIFGFYAQDDYRVRKNLTLNLGLRYEPTTVPTEKYNRLATLVNLTDAQPKIGSPYFNNPTLKNFSPRVGFAWDPFKDGKTSLRGGFGLYDTLPLLYQFELSALLAAPFFQLSTLNGSVVGAGRFPNNVAALLTPDTARVAFVEQNPKRSYVVQWNLNVQREVMKNMLLQVGYVGSHGVHQPYKTQDADIVLPSVINAQGYFWPTPRATSAQRLNPNVGQINGTDYQGYLLYNAMNVRLTERLRKGQIGLSYTWAKSIDNNSASVAGGQFTNSINGLPFQFQGLWRGLSDYDVRQSLVINYLYEIPGLKSGSGVVHSLTNGWQWGGIFRAQSGTPFTATIGGDPLGMLSNNSFDFPDRLNTPECKNPVNPGSVTNYIKTQCFVAPSPANRLGNAGRNTLTGPSQSVLDMSLFKNNYIKRISETFNIQLRMEVFNILNHSNFRPPQAAQAQLYSYSATTGVFTPNAGAGLLTLTSTTSRQIQFAVKIVW
jgi:hypothetical protein